MLTADLILDVIAHLGTAVFAISGALLALRKEHDIVGVAFVATLTGVGGGTLRDLLLGDAPVSWVTDPTDLIICVVCAVLVSLLNRALIGRRLKWLLYADAAGLSLFAVLGAAKAEIFGAHPYVSILFAAISATFGGIIRDVMMNETPVIFQREIYVSAALLSGAVFIIMPASIAPEYQIIAAVLAGLILRLVAIEKQLRIPFPPYDGDKR